MNEKDERMEKPDFNGQATRVLIGQLPILRNECCEITPDIAEDSEQPEWTDGELNAFFSKAFEILIPKVEKALQSAYERGKDEQAEIDAGIAEDDRYGIPDHVITLKLRGESEIRRKVSEAIRAARKRDKNA